MALWGTAGLRGVKRGMRSTAVYSAGIVKHVPVVVIHQHLEEFRGPLLGSDRLCIDSVWHFVFNKTIKSINSKGRRTRNYKRNFQNIREW